MFVTRKVAAGHMIQRDGIAEWLTPEGAWTPSVFEAAAFKKRQHAERVVTRLNANKKSPLRCWEGRFFARQSHTSHIRANRADLPHGLSDCLGHPCLQFGD